MISRMRIGLLIIFLFSCLISTSGAEHNDSGFINITYLNGLTTNNVYDIVTDMNGCVWIGTHAGLSKYDGYNVVNYFKEDMNIRSNIIRNLLCDRKNRIWIGSSSGVGLYDNETGKFLTLDLLIGEQLENKVGAMLEDNDGTIWISFRTGNLIAIDPDTFKVRKFYQDRNTSNYFLRIWFEPEKDLYLAAMFDGDVVFLNPEQGTITPFITSAGDRPFADKIVRGITRISEEQVCMTCEDGTLWQINPFSKTAGQMPFDLHDDAVKVKNTFMLDETKIGIAYSKGLVIYDLKKMETTDRHIADKFINKDVNCIRGNLANGLIIGIWRDGVAIQQESGFRFTPVTNCSVRSNVSLRGSTVTGFAQSNDTTVWITTRQKGLFCYDLKTSRLEHRELKSIPKALQGITSFNNELWLLSRSGIYCYNPGTGAIRSYREGMGINHEILSSVTGKLILLTEGRLLQYNEATDGFIPIKDFEDMTVLGTGHSYSSELVAMTEQKGAVRWNGNKIAENTVYKSSTTQIHPWSGIIFEDEKSHIWTAYPESGIIVSSKEGFNYISTNSGLLSDVVTNIINDDNGNMFITTDRSLSMISPSGKIYSKTKSDGLLNFGFTKESAFKTSTGEILIGSRDGMTIIKAEQKNAEEAAAPVKTAGKVFCNGVEIPLNSNRTAVLKHTQNSFSISIPEITPRNLLSGKSLYCLEGYDQTWIPAGNNRKFSYLNMKPGKYMFHAYNQEIEPVTIRIKAHPLLSTAARLIYTTVLFFLMIFLIMYIRNNEIRKRKENILQMKLKFHQERIDFFTNIAHEIKTPLTLITTPLTNLKNNPSINEEARYDISIMDKHSSYLSSLVREFMDLVKIENKNFNINCHPTNISSKLNNTVMNFTEQNTSVVWNISIPEEPIWVMADTPATTKILNNLLFNALKYAGSFVHVSLTRTKEEFVSIKISNDGEVIPVHMREKIFDSFVQYSSDRNQKGVQEGFGLGLSVAKDLAERQGGATVYGGQSECE